MAETVDCSECGTRYDSQEHPFCPRCGSTAKGASVSGAVASAARYDPSRRRVQASGGVLLAVGLLFLASAVASLLVPAEEAARPLVDALAGQPGGDLVVVFPDDAPANVTLRSVDGEVLENATVENGRFELDSAPSASMTVEADQNGTTWNRTVLVLQGDRVVLDLPEGGGVDDDLVVSPTLATAMSAGRYVFLVLAVALVAGGASALALRVFALAVTGAIVGAFLGLLAIVAFLLLGLLFAVPFGLCAYFIVRGRRHFRKSGKA